MKRLTALFLCITLFSALLLTGANAEPAITKAEAATLIEKMNGYHKTLSDTNGDINIHDLNGTEVTDKETYDRLFKLSGLSPSDDLIFYLLDGDYGTPSFWYDHIGQFLTDDYIRNNVRFNWAIFMLDDKIYRVDSLFFEVTPGLPGLISDGKPIEDRITLIDNDTVLLEAYYKKDGLTKYEVDFEYTDNGWRICGGEATEQFMYYAIAHDNTNPETADSATSVIVCLLASSFGVSVILKKRRYGHTV